MSKKKVAAEIVGGDRSGSTPLLVFHRFEGVGGKLFHYVDGQQRAMVEAEHVEEYLKHFPQANITADDVKATA